MSKPTNKAAFIEKQLTLEILKGIHPPGIRLPTLKDLATRFDVNQATLQRAVARLEARRLVSTRQGSGIQVNDPKESADLSLLPEWLQAKADNPKEATALLSDFLQHRRLIATRLIVEHRHALQNNLQALLAQAAEFSEKIADDDTSALMTADLAFAKVLVLQTNNIVLACVFNTARRMLSDVPYLKEAMYTDPNTNSQGMNAVLAALFNKTSDETLKQAIDTAFAQADTQTLRRYEHKLLKHNRERNDNSHES